MPDDTTARRDTPIPSSTPTRRISLPLRPATDAGRYKATDVIEETSPRAAGAIHFKQKTMDETVTELDGSKLTQEDLQRIQARGGPAAEDVKAMLRRQGERKDGIVVDRIQKHLGFGLREIRVSLDSVVTYSFSAEVRIPDSEKPIPLKLQVLRCGPPLFRIFLLSNVPIQVLGSLEGAVGLENKLLNWLTNPRSITLPGNPGEMRYIYLTAPIIDDILSIMQKKYLEIVPSHPPGAPSSVSDSGLDLPAPAQKPVDPLQSLFGPKPFVPHREKHAEKKEPANTLGIKLEDLEDAKKVSENLDELRQIFSNPQRKFVFRGWEVALTRPGVEGIRLLVSPRHPSDLVDGNAAAINYIVPSEYAVKKTKRDKDLYYIRVKKQEKTIKYTDSEGRASVISLEKLEDSCQILEVPEEPLHSPVPPAPEAPSVQKPAPAPAKEGRRPSVPPKPAVEIPFSEELQSRQALIPPTAAQVLEEAFEVMRKQASELGGKHPSLSQELIFGENIAILVSSGNRTYLMTNADDWNQAKKALEEHLSSETEKIMLTEIQTSYARRTIPLPSGGRVTVTVRPVGKTTIYDGRSDTLEMIPKAAVDAAIASIEKKNAAEEKPDPENEKRLAQTIELIRGAVLSLSGGTEEDLMMDIFIDPDVIKHVAPDPHRWYLIAKTDEGKEYALFRFPCSPEGLNPDITSMPAAIVFTNAMSPNFSFMLIETKFLVPALTDVLLGNWKKPA